MGIKLVKKNSEARARLKTFKKDLVYVPEFTNTKALQELVADIHDQYKNGEDGWVADAVSFAAKPLVLEDTGYPYLLIVGGDFAESIFAFQFKLDRDCVVSDYLPDMM
jgi:hypothetical protein